MLAGVGVAVLLVAGAAWEFSQRGHPAQPAAAVEPPPAPVREAPASAAWTASYEPALIEALQAFASDADPQSRASVAIGGEAIVETIAEDSAFERPAGRTFSLADVRPIEPADPSGRYAMFRVDLGGTAALAIWQHSSDGQPRLDWPTWAETANGELAAFLERHHPGESIVARVFFRMGEEVPGGAPARIEGLFDEADRTRVEISPAGTLIHRLADGIAGWERRLATVELRFGDGFSDYPVGQTAPLQIVSLRSWGILGLPGADTALQNLGQNAAPSAALAAESLNIEKDSAETP